MLRQSVARGVCASCKNEPGCMYLSKSDGIILQCGQFEMYMPPPAAPPIRRDVRTPQADGNGSKKLAGLCQNCDNRDSCIYPKPEGGVWRCEEYA